MNTAVLTKTSKPFDVSRFKLSEIDTAATVCRDSFYDFVVEFWEEIVPEPFVYNWHVEYLCDELQKMAVRVFKGLPRKYDLIINIPPGTTKSTICSIMFPAWLWANMPTARVIGASYADTLQMDLSRFCRNVVRSDRYRAYYPNIKISTDQDAKSYFMNTLGGRRKGVGVGGIAGFHAHFIIVDDPLDPKEAISQAKVEAANWWMNNSLALRKVNKETTPTLLIMQRICPEDCTDNMISHTPEGMIKHIVLPGVLNEESIDYLNPPALRRYYRNNLLDPRRMTDRFLREIRMKGEFLYKAQILQKPVPLGGQMFFVERLNIEKVPPVPSKFKEIIRFWDKAGTKDSGAYSVGVKMGRERHEPYDRYWVLDVVRGQWSSDAREANIQQAARLDGKVVRIGIEQEPGSGGKESAENTIRGLAGYKVYAERPTGDKAQRADPYAGQVNGGNVYLVEGAWNKAYIEELRSFSLENSKYKDQVDASSGAFTKLSEPTIIVGGGFITKGN